METLSKEKISIIINEVKERLSPLFDSVIAECRLFGSCSRGDYTEDSDIDILLLMNCGYLESEKYDRFISEIMTDMMIKYSELVNFICVPYNDFMEKKNWYPLYKNIENEGTVLYG
ncbi:MAG: nucleotidyltransferase domain-containing protein [Lachnospiraceae bacterium]|nr:nucleotidyltransferase domain-containing protein [Lachnospiraceae bacterium]